MFGQNGIGHSPSPGPSLSAMSTPASSSSASVASLFIGNSGTSPHPHHHHQQQQQQLIFPHQQPTTSTRLLPSNHPMLAFSLSPTIIAAPQLPTICVEPHRVSLNSTPNDVLLSSVLAASLASQQRAQQVAVAASALSQRRHGDMSAAAQQLLSELLLLNEQQKNQQPASPSQMAQSQQQSLMPLPFPLDAHGTISAQQMLYEQQQQQRQPPSQGILDAMQQAMQQHKTAIDIIQKALENIAVVANNNNSNNDNNNSNSNSIDQQQQQVPKVSSTDLNAGGNGISVPPFLPAAAQFCQTGLYAQLQQTTDKSGISLHQQQNQQQQQRHAILQQIGQQPTLEEQLLALLSIQQQSAPDELLLNGTTNNGNNNQLYAATSMEAVCTPPSHPPHLLCAPPFQQTASLLSSICNSKGSLPVNGGIFLEQPLDLSQHNNFFFENTSAYEPHQRKNCEIRRSVSSVSYYKRNNADVTEHFQRTFSGKWPRRQPSLRAHIQASGSRAKTTVMGKESAIGESAEAEGDVKDVPMLGAQAAVGNGNNRSNNDGELAIEEEGSVKTERGREEEEKGQQPLAIHRPKSGLPHRLGCTIKKMFSNEDKQVEEHFRKSLGDDRFKQIRSAQQMEQKRLVDVDDMDTRF